MPGLDPNIITHRLNMDPSFKPMKQKRKKFTSERNRVVNQKVDQMNDLRIEFHRLVGKHGGYINEERKK